MPARLSTLFSFLTKRSAVFGFAAAGLFYACSSPQSAAQQPPKADNRYEVIDAEEGRQRLEAFRRQRLDGDYCFRFELEHLPRGGKTVRYFGTMWGSWNDSGPITRIELATQPGVPITSNDAVIEMIFQNGPEPEAWLRRSRKEAFTRLEGLALLQPILEGIVYTPFDLQMPFLYWENFEYKGPVRVRSSIAQTFIMMPPEEDIGITGVRIGIDDSYNALRRIEVMEEGSDPRSEFTVESFKKVQQQWIVKRIVLKDAATGDRTRFRVRAASIGLMLPEQIFLPKIDVHYPVIPESMFSDV